MFKFIVDVWNKLFWWFFAHLSVNHEFVSDYWPNMFSNHLIYGYIYLYVVGVWIVGVVWERWMKLWKYEFLVKNEFDVEIVTKQCYEFVFVSVLIAFWCMLTNNEVCLTILGQWGSKSGLLGRFCVSSREEPKNLGSLY